MRNFFFLLLFAGIILNYSCSSKKDMAIDRSNMDTRTNPGNDFYQYANGGWLEKYPLPDEFSRYGSFDKLAEDNQKIVKQLIEDASGAESDQNPVKIKIGTFYSAGMDSSRIESEGINPLKEEFHKIASLNQKQEITDLVTDWHKRNIPALFRFFGAADQKNSKMVIANIYQGGLGLTDVDYYTSLDAKNTEILERYKEYIIEMLKLSGENENSAASMANSILNFETRLAKASLTRLERRNPQLSYNKMSVSQLVNESPAFDWKLYFSGIGLTDLTDLNVGQPLFFSEISSMLTDEPIENWKAYLKWSLINSSAPYLSSNFVNSNFDFYGKYLSGRKTIQPRWKRIIQIEDYALGEAIGQLFVEKYFPPEAKTRMLELVGNLKLALSERIQNLDWMSDVTKNEAQDKLTKINVKIGYPDKWRDYSGLMVEKDSYFNNVQHAMKFNFEYMLSKIGKPVDPDEWGMTPQTVNAYYSPSRNEIVFPAGILQPPFFYLDADDAVNYGAIGVVIGHEMSHGFDDQGRQYDKDGNLKDWWTKEDADKFDARTKVLVDRFSNFAVLDSTMANGELTLGENIADLGGLNISLTAIRKAWENNPPEKLINGFTPEQRFFLAYSHVWAQNITDKEILRRTKEDVHSLGKFRVNGPLPNVDEFYLAFGIDENSDLFLPSEERARIW